MRLLMVWMFNALSLMIVAHLVNDIHIVNFTTALLAAFVIGLVNVMIKPLLIALTLPMTLLTLGFFILVINGALFYAVGHLLQGFEVNTFSAGFIGALAYSIISWFLTLILPKNNN